MRILVTGASGFAGAALIPRLQALGHDVRAFGRHRGRITAAGVRTEDIVVGDALTGEGLDAALDGIEVAYFLIHSMEAGAESFSDRELRAAANFAGAARTAGVRRVVYLGVVTPDDDRHSDHVASRRAVESALAASAPEVVTLRASIAIAGRSRSFRFLVRLVERVPVMPLPNWREFRTQPIDGRDVLAFLVAAGTRPDIDGQITLDIAGPEIVSYGDLIDRIRHHMLVGRPAINLPVAFTPIASVVASAITGEDLSLIRPLMDGLAGDLLPSNHAAAERLGVRLHSLDSAIERALAELERAEPLAAR